MMGGTLITHCPPACIYSSNILSIGHFHRCTMSMRYYLLVLAGGAHLNKNYDSSRFGFLLSVIHPDSLVFSILRFRFSDCLLMFMRIIRKL